MRLGIFGGTFNPPHMGHIRLVTAIADKLQLDRVLIIPASVPPVPTLATRISTLPLVSSQISGPVVFLCAAGLAGFSN